MTAPVFATNFDGLSLSGGVASAANSSPTQTCDRNITVSGTAVPIITLDAGANRTSGSIGFTARRGGSTTTCLVKVLDSSGNLRFQLIQSSGDVYKFQYWNGSAMTDLGTTFTWSTSGDPIGTFRVDFSGLGGASGAFTFRGFNDGTEVDFTNQTVTGLNLTGTTNFRSLNVSYNGTSDIRISGVFIKDGSGLASYMYSNVSNADGTDTDGTGTFASIVDTGSSFDTTFISLPSSTNHRSVKNTVARNYDSRVVKAVGVAARLRCGATGPTQCKPYLKIGGTRYYWGTQVLTTAFASYNFVWETDPSTGVAWTLTNAQAAALEYGMEAI